MKSLKYVRSKDRLMRDRKHLVRQRRECEEAGPISFLIARREGLIAALDQRIVAIDQRMATLEFETRRTQSLTCRA
jgi:hypothetical protein